MCAEVSRWCGYGVVVDVGDGFAVASQAQGFGMGAPAAAGVTANLGWGEEIHLKRDVAGSLALRAAALGGVETESAGTVTAQTGFGGRGKQLAAGVKETDVGRGRCTWRAGNGGWGRVLIPL